MVERADIVLENYRPGVMDRLGLGYDALSAVNPRIILGSVSGYGHGNPWSHRGAFAAAVQAETGLTADIARRREHHPAERSGLPGRRLRRPPRPGRHPGRRPPPGPDRSGARRSRSTWPRQPWWPTT